MEAYEVWRTVMYTVGVFVTCNVGGQALLSVKNRLTKREPEGVAARMGVRTPKGMKVISDPEKVAAFLSKLSDADKADAREMFHKARQTFDDIRRQIDTPEADCGLDDEDEFSAKPKPDKAANDKEDFFSD